MKKIINKPWGREEWLELNDKYCYKRIYINKGTRTSYQYHKKKLETNYIISGEAEVWLENDQGVVEKSLMFAGDFFTVRPPKKHRVIALTDIILQEVSTPEVDDVVRIEDDTGRGSGKILSEHKNPALCILTAGTGKRMGGMSLNTNKALLPLAEEAAITHIIKKAPANYDIVVVLGYKSSSVREYCEAAHPERNFIFVYVDKYTGPGTGPGYSILQAKNHLNRPFVWTTSDTIVVEPFPDLENDWMGVHPTSVPELYSTAKVENGLVVDFINKSPAGFDNAFIGLAGVKNYEKFWDSLENNKKQEKEIEIVGAYYKIEEEEKIHAKTFTWYDIGTVDNYLRAKSSLEKSTSYSLEKNNGEFIYRVNDRYIKLSDSKDFISGRIQRSKNLENFVPKIIFKGQNVYSYKWIDGDTLYNLNDTRLWSSFLDFMKREMWQKEKTDISKNCRAFYKEKTYKRLDLFLDARDASYEQKHVVMGIETDSIKDLLKKVNWKLLETDVIPTKMFHGDLQFDNVIYGSDEKFYLLDWRQDFAKSEIGDAYYDLAKLYGGILMSYSSVKDRINYSCTQDKSEISFSFARSSELIEFEKVFIKWVKDHNFNFKKIKILVALIYLNMSPLHERTLGDILFFNSKLMLQSLCNAK